MVGISLTVEPRVLNSPFFTGTLSELASMRGKESIGKDNHTAVPGLVQYFIKTRGN